MSEQEPPSPEQTPNEPKAADTPGLRWVARAAITLGALACLTAGGVVVWQWRTAPPVGSIQIPETNCSLFTVPGNVFQAYVIDVPDADDIQVRTQDIYSVPHELRVRLAEIDSPEFGQPFYDNVKQFIANEALNRNVSIRFREINDFSHLNGKCRIIGWVMLPNGDDLSRKLISNGYSWHYLDYSSHAEEYEELQANAKRNRLGLWADSTAPIAPWNFREMKRKW